MVADFKKNKSGQRLLWLGGVGMVSSVIFLVVADVKMYQRRKEYFSQMKNLQIQVQNLNRQDTDLQQAIQHSQDDSYIEKVAREQLDLQKKDEQAVAFILPKPTNQEILGGNKTMIQIWLGWLSNIFSQW